MLSKAGDIENNLIKSKIALPSPTILNAVLPPLLILFFFWTPWKASTFSPQVHHALTPAGPPLKQNLSSWWPRITLLSVHRPSIHLPLLTADTSWLHQQLSSSLQFEIFDESNTFPAYIHWSHKGRETRNQEPVFSCAHIFIQWVTKGTLFISSVRSSNSHPDLLVIQHHPRFFRSHRSSTLDFHFLSHYSYINAIMLYKGKTWQDSGILWHTLVLLSHTLTYSGIL